jgi:uncharacterized protein YgiM (DUF1202 family)
MMKKEQSIYTSVRQLTERIRKEVKDEVSLEYEEAQRQGKYPWEGMWLTSADIRKVQAKLRKRDRTVFIEIIVLFALLTLFSSAFLQIIYTIIPQPGESTISPYLNIASQSESHSSAEPASPFVDQQNQHMGTREPTDREESSDEDISDTQISESAKPIRSRVAVNMLRLRAGPGTDYPIIARLKYGTSVTVQDTAGKWMKVETDTSVVGWVFSEYIEREKPYLKRASYTGRINAAAASRSLTETDTDQTTPGDTQPQDVKRAETLTTGHAEMPDGTSDAVAREKDQAKLSQGAEDGDNEYTIQVGAWRHRSYAQTAYEKLKKYYPQVRSIEDHALIKITIPDVKTRKEGSVIQKKIERKFNLHPVLIRTNRKDVIAKQVTEEPDAALPDVEKSSPAMKSNSAYNAGNKTAGGSTGETRRTADVGSNIIRGIAVIVKSSTTENDVSSP